MKKERGLFDEEFRLEKLTKLGDKLLKLAAAIDFEIFRPTLEAIFSKGHKGKGGRPPYDYVMMFKIVILQRYYNISDDQMEFQINDRLSFQRFLGLTLSDTVPDSKTLWLFKETLAQGKKGDDLFDLFSKELDKVGLIANEGEIVDATFVDVPKQRNSREENATIKEGKVPKDWIPENDTHCKETMTEEDLKKKHRLSRKDTDARWAMKRKETHYGYKNHVKADAKTKIITKYTVTTASVHDSNEFKNLVDKGDKKVWADSGYVGKEDEFPEDVRKDVKFIICEKGTRGIR